MLTALLIDGSKEPIGYLTDTQSPFVVWGGSVNQQPRQFKLIRTETGRDANGKEITVLIYRLHSHGGMSEEAFEAQAAAESDKYLHPEKYKDLGVVPQAA